MKRYSVDHIWGTLEHDPEVDWVRFDDAMSLVDALAQQANALKARVNRLQSELNEWRDLVLEANASE